jgi:hypothetical protein
VQGLLLAAAVSDLERQAAGQQLTVVVDIAAAATPLHVSLEQLGFFPTVYYPGLIAPDRTRADAVQYTRLFNVPFADSRQRLAPFDYPLVTLVVDTVEQIQKEAAILSDSRQ